MSSLLPNSPLPNSLPSLRLSASLQALALALSMAAFGCATDDGLVNDKDREDEGDILFESNGYQNNPLILALSEPFDMCFFEQENTLPSAGYGVDLNTAKWLSFFSANEYAHYAHFAPVLQEMGFGDEGEGTDWVNTARNVLETRDLEEAGRIPNGGSAVFEQHVIQDVEKGKKIQFFAAGKIETDDTGFEFFNDESTQMLWAEHRTEPIVIIAFRGTETDEYLDIVADLVATKTDRAGYGSAHTGFQSAYDGVESILKAKLAAESGRGLQIWITGHSLGGALASLATTTVMDHIKSDTSYSLRGIYTYGMPRVGNDTYAEQVELGYVTNDVRAMRFRNGDDAVTQVPWQWMGFHQTGNLMHLRGEGNFDFDPVDQDPGDTAENSGALADHSIPTYYSRIGAFFTSPYEALGNRCSY